MRPALFLAAFSSLILLAGIAPASGQSRIFTSYTKSDGLPSDYVMRISQSPSGFMWFATERGAARYDGTRFTTFTTDDGLPHNMVYDILEDAQGRTWFATTLPTLAYLRHGEIRIFRSSSGSLNPIGSMAMDRNNRVYFRHSDGLGVLNGDDYQFHPIPLQTSKESNFIRLLDGRVALSVPNHVLAVRLDSGTDLRFDTLLTVSKANTFTTIQQAPDSTVYLTLSKGVARYRLQADTLVEMETFGAGFYTTMSIIGTASRHKVLLGGRYTGLKLLENGTLSQVLTSMGSERGFISHQMVDYEGNLWIGVFGQGVEKLTTWNAELYNELSGLPEHNVWRVSSHRGDPLAMGVAGIRRIRDQRAEPLVELHPALRAIRGIQFGADRAYIGSMSSLRVHQYDAANNRIGREIRSIDMSDGVNDVKQGPDGSIWIAAAGMRLFRLRPDGSLTSVPVANGVERIFRTDRAMWFLTSDDGAMRYDGREFRTYSKATGHLRSDGVYTVAEDVSGILFGTASGLTWINPLGDVTHLDVSHGLNGSPVIGLFPTADSRPEESEHWVVTPYQLHRFKNGRLERGNSLATLSTAMQGAHWIEPSEDRNSMLIGTTMGLVVYDLTQTGRTLPPPKVALVDAVIGSQRFPNWNTDPIQARSASTTLEFHFTGLTFVKESDTRFSYRLIGVDADWSSPQPQRTVRYANIRPGTYEFQVRALNTDGVPSSEFATMVVTIDPPWWLHPVFLLMLAAASVGALFAGVRWRIRRIRADIVKRNEQKQFEAIQRIGASISHDIKNTVFSLSLLSKNLEKRFDNPEFRKDAIDTIESSLSYLSTLVDRLQRAPDATDSRQQHILLRSLCQDVVKRVLSGTDRRIDLDIDEALVVALNPEPLERILENLIRNAVEATEASRQVRVGAQRIGMETEIFIIDEGHGMSPEFIEQNLFKPFHSTKSKGLGIGLYTCKELADAMGATIHVDSELGKGSTFRLRFVSSPT